MTGTLSIQEAALRAEKDPLCCGFVRQVPENVFYWKRAGSGFCRIFRQDAASVSGKWETYYIKERMDIAAEDVTQDCAEAVRAAQRAEHAAWEQHRSLCNQTVVPPQFCFCWLSRLKLPAPDAVLCSCAHACCLKHWRSRPGKQALSSPRSYREKKCSAPLRCSLTRPHGIFCVAGQCKPSARVGGCCGACRAALSGQAPAANDFGQLSTDFIDSVATHAQHHGVGIDAQVQGTPRANCMRPAEN